MNIAHSNNQVFGILDYETVYEGITKLSYRILADNKNEILNFRDLLTSRNEELTAYARTLYETAHTREDLTCNFFLDKHMKQRQTGVSGI